MKQNSTFLKTALVQYYGIIRGPNSTKPGDTDIFKASGGGNGLLGLAIRLYFRRLSTITKKRSLFSESCARLGENNMTETESD